MRHALSDDQLMFQDSIEKLLAREWPDARLRTFFEANDEVDHDIWSALMELGVGAVMVPEEYGGLGLGLLDLSLGFEAFGAAALGGPFIAHALATLAIAESSSEAVKKKWLSKLARGESIATLALRDDGTANGWQPEEWAMSPSRLDGIKRFVPAARTAALYVVGLAGGALGVVEAGDGSTTVIDCEVTDRTRRVADVRFSGAKSSLLENVNASRIYDAGLILLAADAHGGARRMLNMAVEYAKLRKQFGAPIGSFQAIKHQLADTAIMIEPNAALYRHAAALTDERDPRSGHMAAAAKAHITECFSTTARRCLEAHGGIGYTWEHPAHIWLRRAMFDWTYFGAPQSLRSRAAACAAW